MITLKRLMWLLLLCAAPLVAQTSYSVLIPTTPPGGIGGACSSAAVAYLVPTGGGNAEIAVCSGNVWTVLGGTGTVTVVSSGSLTSTACVTGGGSQTIQTPSSNCTVDSNGNLTANSLIGGNTSDSGVVYVKGLTSGGVALAAADVAGTAITYMLPSTNGVAGQFLEDSGSATCGTYASGTPSTCHQLTWAAAGSATNTTPAISLGGFGSSYSSNLGGTNNTLYLWLVNIPGPTTIAKMDFQVSSSTNQAWSVYSVAGSLLATGGTGTGCGGCWYSTTLSYTFSAAGAYYIGFCANGSTNISVSGTTYGAPGAGSISTPFVATAANSCNWSGSTPNFPSSAGTLTTLNSVGYPLANLTY